LPLPPAWQKKTARIWARRFWLFRSESFLRAPINSFRQGQEKAVKEKAKARDGHWDLLAADR
jgi:hypothetical protein